MEGTQKNKMAEAPMKKLLLKMGLPMIISMVLQALYNVIDSIFVANMGEQGAIANQALTLAFPIQILIIAIGVGTGIGLNALLSKSLGEKNQDKVNKVAGNGIFLSVCIFLVFLLFGLFGSEWFISLFAGGNQEVIAMFFHYTKNKEINGNLKYIKPEIGIIKGIYKIGISAAIMQALLSVMMAGMNAILGGAKADPTILVGSFGIYYKIQQIALFSAFGLSNTIISILSFNYGMKDKDRINDCIKYGLIDTAMVTFILTIFFEIFAKPLSSLFALSGGTSKEIIEVCTISLRIASIGYIFMGFSVAVQGILQSLGYAIRPLIISLLRLVVFVFPIAYLFTLSDNVTSMVWWTLPIAEILTSIISVFILRKTYKERIAILEEKVDKNIINNKLIISISREHGTGGKEIGRKVAQKLGLEFFDKEEIKKFAIENSLIENNYNDDELYKFYLSLDVEKDSIIKQAETIKLIASKNNCVIVGRCADYILKDEPNLIKIFLYAPSEYRINKIKEMYKDTHKEAEKHVVQSDKSRASYYEIIANKKWGDKENYDICLDCSIGNEKVVNIICDYIKEKSK